MEQLLTLAGGLRTYIDLMCPHTPTGYEGVLLEFLSATPSITPTTPLPQAIEKFRPRVLYLAPGASDMPHALVRAITRARFNPTQLRKAIHEYRTLLLFLTTTEREAWVLHYALGISLVDLRRITGFVDIERLHRQALQSMENIMGKYAHHNAIRDDPLSPLLPAEDYARLLGKALSSAPSPSMIKAITRLQGRPPSSRHPKTWIIMGILAIALVTSLLIMFLTHR